MPRATTATKAALPKKAREPREVTHLADSARRTRPLVFNDTPETSARVEAMIDPVAGRKKSDVLREIMAAGLPLVEERYAPKAKPKRAPRKVASAS